MKKICKKMVAVVAAAAMLSMSTVPVMAADVFVKFICAGQISGQSVPAGSNVVAPAVPVVGGFTFCGFDRSLKNVTENTTYTAVYVNTALGDAAINATKASLPTPAISATTVANPNLVMPAVVPAAAAPTADQLQAAQAAQQAQALQAAQQAAVVPQVPAAPAAAAGVPSWVVGLEGVDAQGAATAYNYLKNTKGLDDGTIQANWAGLMHHYAGHGVQGW